MRTTEYTKRKFWKLLRSNGYYIVRTCGSHFVWQNSKGNTLSINKDPNRMVVKRLIKEYNLK